MGQTVTGVDLPRDWHRYDQTATRFDPHYCVLKAPGGTHYKGQGATPEEAYEHARKIAGLEKP